MHRWSLILTGSAELRSFPADEPHGPAFYRRAMRAHANCVENLPVFAAIVFAGTASGLASGPFGVLSVTVPAGRAMQTIVHFASGSNPAVAIRFAFFAIQLGAFLWMAVLIVLHAA